LAECALRNRTIEGRDDQVEETTIKELSKKYPWWSPATMTGKPVDSASKMEKTTALVEARTLWCDGAPQLTSTGECARTEEDSGMFMLSVCNCCMYWPKGGGKGGEQRSKNGAVDSEHETARMEIHNSIQKASIPSMRVFFTLQT
jgi:hypothetical protein